MLKREAYIKEFYKKRQVATNGGGKTSEFRANGVERKRHAGRRQENALCKENMRTRAILGII